MSGTATFIERQAPPADVADGGPSIASSSPAAQNETVTLLGEQLLMAGVIGPEQLEATLARQHDLGLKLGEALIELGFVTEDEILPFIVRRLNMPSVRLRDGMVDPVAVRIIPREKAEALGVLALFRVRNTLCVAMAEPQNLEHIDEIERITNLRVRAVIAHRNGIQRMIQRCYEEDFQVDAVTADMEEFAVEISEDMVKVDLECRGAADDSSPIINLVNFLIMQALRQKASDIHIEPGRRRTFVRFRVDGQLRELLQPRRDLHAAIISRIKVIAKMDIAEHRLPQDGQVHVAVEGREVDLRVSTLPTVLGEKAGYPDPRPATGYFRSGQAGILRRRHLPRSNDCWQSPMVCCWSPVPLVAARRRRCTRPLS